MKEQDMDLKILETERLILSRLSLTDKDFIFRLLNEESWKRFIGDKNIKTLADAENYILNVPVKMYDQYGFSLFLVSAKESGASIGLCGLIKRDGLDEVDIGFAFLPEYCGTGYAKESASAVIDYAQNTHGLNRLQAITVSYNLASKKLLESLGFQFRKIIQLEGDTEELELYELLLDSLDIP